MSGLGGLNKAPDGVVIGLVQIQNPVVVTPEDLAKQTDRICVLVAKARRNLATMGFWSCFLNTPCMGCRWTSIRRSCAGSTGHGMASCCRYDKSAWQGERFRC